MFNEIKSKLMLLSNPERAVQSKKYLKSPYTFYGIQVPQIRKIAKKYKNLDINEVYNLFSHLWNSGNHEEMSFAIFLLQNYKKQFNLETWNFIKFRLEKLKTWDHVDALSSWILGPILEQDISLANEIKQMAVSRNPWIRRTSIVSTYPLIKKNKIELTLRLAEILIHDPDIYVQKGTGWMLREAGKKQRITIREFILIHLDMKPYAFSYATEKMPELRQIRKNWEKNIKMGINLEKIRNEKPIKELLKFSIINIDKPSGPTSFWVSQFVCRSFKLTKTSHFGTLDPQVTGVLPVALSRACRLNEYFMHKDKMYVGIMRLHKDVSDELLKSTIKQFLGKIIQLPPVRSRVKRAEREREIKSFEILEREDKDILFLSQVQAGTYIRKLVYDIGERIGGAHMLELRRTKASIFNESNSVNLYDFEKAAEEYKKGNEALLRKILIPAEIILQVLPVVQVKEESVQKLLTGKPLFKRDIIGKLEHKDEKLALFCKDRFIETARVANEGDIIARPEFVFN